MADPGFPVGGAHLVGGVDSRGGYVSKNLYVEMRGTLPWIHQWNPSEEIVENLVTKEVHAVSILERTLQYG